MTNQLLPSQFLKLAYAKIDSPEKWTQDVFARDCYGNETGHLENNAVCFCSYGALNNVVSSSDPCWGIAYIALAEFMEKHVPSYNDSHTWQEVSLAWQQAIKQLEEKGQ